MRPHSFLLPAPAFLPARSRIAALLAVLLSCALALPVGGVASAAPLGDFTTFRLGDGGYGGNAIASGPDGNMWFTNNANNSIGRITPSGTVTYFEVPTDPSLESEAGLFAITAGPDGNMWFTGFYANIVGKVTPDGRISTYPVPLAQAFPLGISAGPDGNVWFTLDFANAIGRVTPAGKVTLFSTDGAPIISAAGCVMCGYYITAGPLDSLWYTLPSVGLVGRMTTRGDVSTFRVPTASDPATSDTPVLGAITAGVDGNLWITQHADGKVTRMTPKGAVTDFDLSSATSLPSSIAPGPDASLWVSEAGSGALARIDISGAKAPVTVTQFPVPTDNSIPGSVAVGADGSVWFSNLVLPPGQPGTVKLQIGRVGTGVGPLVTAKVKGTPEPGSRLTCAYVSTQAAVVATVRYQWFRNGKPMRHEDARRFTVHAADKGDSISCRASVTYATALYQLAGTSAPVKIRRP